MLFRPSFCANCGEKVERAEWHLWTSRRFCEVCETEFKGHDLLPRVIVLGSLLVGVAGIGNYMNSPDPVSHVTAKQPKRIAEQPTAERAPKPSDGNSTPGGAPVAMSAVDATTPGMTRGPSVKRSSANLRNAATDEPIYFCGAATKKGTACTRRVKGNTRCYQHLGMPSMLPADKLRVG